MSEVPLYARALALLPSKNTTPARVEQRMRGDATCQTIMFILYTHVFPTNKQSRCLSSIYSEFNLLPDRRFRQRGTAQTRYWGTSLIRTHSPLGSYSMNMLRALWWS